MSINFKRNRTQQKYESILGISSVEELVQNKQNFKTHVLSREEANQQGNDPFLAEQRSAHAERVLCFCGICR